MAAKKSLQKSLRSWSAGVRQLYTDISDLGNLADRRWNGSLRISSSVDFWYLRISRSATVPGL